MWGIFIRSSTFVLVRITCTVNCKSWRRRDNQIAKHKPNQTTSLVKMPHMVWPPKVQRIDMIGEVQDSMAYPRHLDEHGQADSDSQQAQDT